MRLRAATPADAGTIAGIWNGYIRETAITFTDIEKTAETVAADIAARRKGGLYLMAEEDGAVLGFATAFPFRGGPGYRHTLELTVHVAPDARRHGAGRALLAGLEAAARDAGAHVLVAGVSGENPDAIAFHVRQGFAEVGRMPEVGRKFGRWLDLVLMQKIL